MFNITAENWDQCVSGPDSPTVHGEANVGKPVQGVRAVAPAPTADLRSGDLAFARKKEAGVKGIWEVRDVVDISDEPDRNLRDDAEYSTLVYCDPIQREFETPYEEDWDAFADEFNDSVNAVRANIRGAVHNLKPAYKKRYLTELLKTDLLNEQASERLEDELRTMEGDGLALPDYWEMVDRKRTLSEAFLEEPSRELFEELMDPDHFWSQLNRMYEYEMDEIFSVHSPAEVADLIREARETDSPELINEIHRFNWGKSTELLRSLEPTQYAILNRRAIAGMEALGYSPPDRGSASPAEYQQFVDNVREAASRYDLRGVADDHADEPIPDWATDLEVVDFVFSRHFDGAIDLSELREDACVASSETAPYYWVNQTQNPEEIEGEYLQAPADEAWYHDVGKLEPGDQVFNYTDGQVIGYSTVEASATPVTIDGDEHCRVDVDLTRFDEPLDFREIFSYLARDDVQLDTYYPVNKGGINQQYLFNLSAAAGEYLLAEGSGDEPETDHEILTRYQASSSPTVWMYSSGPSDWLTILRRGAMQFWDDVKSQWEQLSPGDIVLLHMTTSDGDQKAIPDYAISQSGLLGLGIIGGKRTKTERWWWNENDSLAYPYIAEFEECYIAGGVETLDRQRAMFELDEATIKTEVDALAASLIPWETATELSLETTEKEPPAQRSIVNLSANRSGVEDFLEQFLSASDAELVAVQFDGSDDLPAMLPASDKPATAADVARQLEKVGQVVFHGPPGTGKTYTATRFARWWIHQQTPRPVETRLRMVTFHPSFAYEDFMEGLSADTTAAGQVTYEYEPGIFKKIYRDARDAYEAAESGDEAPRYVLIVDEINRGNLSQIFGEIITQLEMDKRLGQEEQVTLEWAHSGEQVAVPPNLHLIGTMNTADRSIALIDAALRRRFSFHSFPPDTDVIVDAYDEFSSRAHLRERANESTVQFDTVLARSVRAVEAINHNIITESDLTRGKRIGHSYLLGLENLQDIVDAWEFAILPLLSEYYFGDFDRLRREVFADELGESGPATISQTLFDLSTGETGSFDAEELATALLDLITRHDFSQHESNE